MIYKIIKDIIFDTLENDRKFIEEWKLDERNTFIIEDKNKNLFGIIQIAARGVRRCIALVKENDDVSQGDIIGKIRFGSQVDMIFPRNYTVLVREGDQVYAGISIIASIDE